MIEEHLWAERHRPDTLDEVIGQDEAVGRLKSWVEDDSVPHVLLNGPAGTGKTASVVSFAKDKFGDDWKGNLIQMNASDDRGIDVVRDQIKKIARESPSGNYTYKIIYLDEADHLTKDAQAALRRTMEQFSDNTRFFLSVNYINKIIDPIQSRCTVLPYNRLSDDEIDRLLTRILDSEGVDYEEGAVSKIIDYVGGDARRAVQTLQTSVEDGELSEDLLDVVGGQVDEEVISDIVDSSLKGDMESVHSEIVSKILPNVTDYSRFSNNLMGVVRQSDDIPDDTRWYAISRVGEMESRILDGASPQVQVMSYMAELPMIRNSSIGQYDK